MTEEPVWWKLTLHASQETLELLGLLLMDHGAGGVIEEQDALIAFFSPHDRPRAEAAMAAFAQEAVEARPTWVWQREEGEPWRDAWKEHFLPTRLSERLAVCPSWLDPPEYDAEVQLLRLDPGRAFGTGTHETTRLCLQMLDRSLSAAPARRCLDVGCGSGILSVAAAKLGVPCVVALDIDPQAAAVTRENAAANGVAARVHPVCGELRAVSGTYPLVMANILYQILLGLAPGLAARLAPEGILLLSGLLKAELASAAQVYGGEGLFEMGREVDGEWGALLLQRR